MRLFGIKSVKKHRTVSCIPTLFDIQALGDVAVGHSAVFVTAPRVFATERVKVIQRRAANVCKEGNA